MFKLTSAQTWLVHSLETIATGAIVAGGIAAEQAIASGNYSYTYIAPLVGAAVLAVLSKGWSTTIQNNANLGQAIFDGVAEVKGLIIQQPSAIAPQQAQGPLVVQHITQLPESANVTPAPSVRQLNVVPPRPIVQPPVQMPQALPAVDVASLSTQQVPQVPFERSFSMPMAAVQPGQ
jgi:hypothetical protein